MTRVLSVDLAYVKYTDIGVALLEQTGGRISARLLEVPLVGRPVVADLVEWLVATAASHDAAGICIDGPLGWKGPHTDAEHCRLSERSVRAPGKTGLPPDGVKPRTYLPFTEFSIAMFEAITLERGFMLPGQARSPSSEPFVTETFPTAAWRALGLPPLPAKSKTKPTDLAAAVSRLVAATGVILDASPTHDQLQAVVGGLAGLAWARGAKDEVMLAGAPPFRLDDSWREGYIMIPAAPSARLR